MRLRRRGTGDSNEIRHLVTRKCLTTMLLRLILQYRLYSPCDVPFPYLANGLRKNLEGFTKFGIIPILCRFKEDIGPL
jgi:hypothetical protein